MLNVVIHGSDVRKQKPKTTIKKFSKQSRSKNKTTRWNTIEANDFQICHDKKVTRLKNM